MLNCSKYLSNFWIMRNRYYYYLIYSKYKAGAFMQKNKRR